MEILTGSYCEEGQAVALLLRKTIRRRGKIPIVFLCVLKGDFSRQAQEKMDQWFQERALTLCERGDPGKAVDAVEKDFTAWRAGFAQDMTVLFCMGGECFYVWQGEMGIVAINHFFSKAHVKRLTSPGDGGGCERAALEQGVGMVLGDREFFAHLTEEQLKECLRAGEISSQEQAKRRLEEAAREAKRRGAVAPLAAMLLLKEDVLPEFESLLRRNGYEDPRPVGRGAFGSVYRVKNAKDGKWYACKVAEGMYSRDLLRRESLLQQKLEHPLFAAYRDSMEGEFCTLLVMEYVRGRDLSAILARRHLSGRQAVKIAIQLAEGLQYLHTLPDPVLYRDLKPENIRITIGGRAKLLDLGCACQASEAEYALAGSRGYAAPEQMGQTGASPGFYSDIYSLGRVIARMTQGEELSDGLGRLVAMCVSDKPLERFQSLEPVIKILKNLESGG